MANNIGKISQVIGAVVVPHLEPHALQLEIDR